MEGKNLKFSLRFVSLVLLFALLIALLPVPARANPDPGWYNASWKYRKTITFTSDSGKIPSTQSEFPVLVNLSSDTDLAADAQNDGDDILFTLSDATTKLSHEIEKFDGNTGELIAWVKVTSLSTSGVIYLYYGNASCSSQQSASSVWDSNFKMVQHLKENSGTHYDSTSNDNDGTPNGGVTQGTTGQINGAGSFDGSNDYVQLSYNFPYTGDVTVEAWVKVLGSGTNDLQIIAGTEDGFTGGQGGYSLSLRYSTSKFQFAHGDGTGGSHWDVALSNAHASGQWYHLTGVHTSGQDLIYVNGTSENPHTNSYSLAIGTTARIGRYPNDLGEARTFNGTIDEVRVSDTARSADWIKAEYSNQNDPSTFYTLGNETKNWESYRDSGSPPTTVWGEIVNPYAVTYHTVYMYGEGYTSGHTYSIGFYDNDSDPGNKIGSDTVVLDGTTLSVQFELITHSEATAGTWHAVVFDNASPPATYAECSGASGYTVEDDLQVGVDAIPEFPAFFSAIGVSGLCFGIYYLIRKRRMQASPRTS